MSLLSELRRRNVIRVGAAYLVSAWLIVQVAETIFPLFGFGDGPARLVVILLAIGLVPVLVLAWVFESTPQGLKRDSEVDRSSPEAGNGGRRLDHVVMVLLALGLTYFAVDKFVVSESRESKVVELTGEDKRSEALPGVSAQKSILVLPFVDISDDPDAEFFSDGFSEEILDLLAGISELRVIARSSAFAFKNQSIDVPGIAEQLNVSHVLQGTVRRSADTLRITAQLFEGATDTRLWAETYEQDLDDVFAIQNDIAASVSEQLRLALVEGKRPSASIDVDAYALYLEAQHYRQIQSVESLERAEDLYKQALELEPNYVPAWIGLAAVYDNQLLAGYREYDEGYALEQSAIDRALRIDPDSASAIDSLAWLVDKRDNDYAQSTAYVARALELEPHNIDVLASSARIMTSLGRLDEAAAIRRYVLARDPLNPIQHNNLGALNLFRRDFPGVKTNLSRALAISPDFHGGQYLMGLAELFLGNHEEALARFEAEIDDLWRLKGRALALQAMGHDEEANTALASLIEAGGDDWPTEVAHVYAYWNDVDQAFEWLARDTDPGGWAEGRLNPLFDNLRDDPRWHVFLEEHGVSTEQLSTIAFDVELPGVR